MTRTGYAVLLGDPCGAWCLPRRQHQAHQLEQLDKPVQPFRPRSAQKNCLQRHIAAYRSSSPVDEGPIAVDCANPVSVELGAIHTAQVWLQQTAEEALKACWDEILLSNEAIVNCHAAAQQVEADWIARTSERGAPSTKQNISATPTFSRPA